MQAQVIFVCPVPGEWTATATPIRQVLTTPQMQQASGPLARGLSVRGERCLELLATYKLLGIAGHLQAAWNCWPLTKLQLIDRCVSVRML